MNIAVTGYYGTGSSAVLDLLSEYEGCSEAGLHSYEHIPFYYPNGLFDLEYKLLYCNDPHRSDEAIKSFRKAMYELNEKDFGWCGSYKKMYGDDFKIIVDEFIEGLVQHTCEGEWYNYSEDEHFSFLKFTKDCIKALIPGKKVYGKFGFEPFKLTVRKMEFSFPSEQEFFDLAKKFVRNYIKMINRTNVPNLLLDHLVFPHNAYKLEKYFDDDFRLIVVDRDIRDMFALCKYIWKSRGYATPYPEEPSAFLSHWKKMKNAERRINHPQVLYINFEDLVYNYDQTVRKIENFVGFSASQHKCPKKRFIPENSINNTQNFKIEKEWEQEVETFTDVDDYLYNFPYEHKTELSNTFDEQE